MYEKLEILERNQKRFDLNANLEGAYATRAGSRILGKPKSRRRGKDSQTRILCRFCEQHLRDQCELRRLLMTVISGLKLSDAKENKYQKKISHFRRHSRGTWALAAKDQSDHDLEVGSITESCDEDGEVESCQYFKKKSRPCQLPNPTDA